MPPTASPSSPQDTETMYYETLGSNGPVVVLLHGWGRSLDALRPLGELLSESFRVVLIDLPGFGRSPLPHAASNAGGGWGTSEYAARVQELLLSLNILEYTLVGHSFGGRVSVRIAAAAPESVQGVVLIGAPGVPYKKPLRVEVRARAIRTLVSVAKIVDGLVGTRFFAHYLAPRFGSRDYKAAGEMKMTFVKTINEDLTADARNIKAPTLLLWGENDAEAPVAIARQYRELIADSSLHLLQGRGHEPFADVGSHLITTYIERFFEDKGIGRAH